jgi:uncharacterized protein (TIGR02678 family)
VVYYDELDERERSYLTGQRGRLLRLIEAATCLEAEVRAEGIAMVDPRGDLTDLGLPEEGTDGHVTLLVATYLAEHARTSPGEAVSVEALRSHVARLSIEHRVHWRKDATEPGSERALVDQTVERLEALRLVRCVDDGVVPRAAIGRYALIEPPAANAAG